MHPKVLKNQLFIKAVDWLIDNKKVGSQKELALITGINEPTFSNIRNDKKVVSDKTIRKFLDAFPGIFNPDYFRGQNIYMTISEQVDANTDDISTIQKEPSAYIDPLSQANATIAAYMEAIESLKRELITKDKLLEEKDARIAEKDERIAELKAHNRDLRQQLNKYENSDIDRYPFPIGAADGDKHKTARK